MVKKKKKASDFAEELDATGQESDEKAAKWIIEKQKTEEKEQKEEEAEDQWRLHDTRKQNLEYHKRLKLIMERRMREYATPPYFRWYATLTKKGLVLGIADPKGIWYAKGMQISHLPFYDLSGIDTLIMKGLDFMNHLEKKYEEKDKGIILS